MYFRVILLVACFVLAPQTAAADTGLLWLINRDNPVDADFMPQNLVEYKGVRLHSTARSAFVEMITAMETDGITGVCLQSAYRPYSHQRAIFDQRVKELMAKGNNKNEAEQIASESIQPPGASEHQTGLALDVSINGQLTKSFADTKAGRWLDANSHSHGFIIRYPKHKTAITNITFEPWHLRYVGTPHASIMKNMNLTLEEYWKYLAQVQTFIQWGAYGNYQLITYSHAPPDSIFCELTNISSYAPMCAGGYIIVVDKVYPQI